MSGAVEYLFNYCSHEGQCTTKLEKFLFDWMPGYQVGTCINNGDCTGKQWAMATGGVVIDTLGGAEGKAGAAAAKVVRTEAANLVEQLALDAAKAGEGRRIMQGLINDPRFPENAWAKMQLVVKSDNGVQAVVHYWKRLEDGFATGFKFKD